MLFFSGSWFYIAFGLIRVCVHGYVVLAYEQNLSEGLRTERRLFHMTFATEDQREGTWNVFLFRMFVLPSDVREPGMTAFAEKRKPKFINF